MKKLIIVSILVGVISSGNSQDLEFLLWKGDNQSVISHLEPPYKNGNLDPEKSILLALAYSAEKNYTKSLQILESLTENAKVLRHKAECLTSLGNYIDASKILKKIYEDEPDNTDNAAKLGKIYLNIKENEKAAKVFEKLSNSDTTNVFYLRNYAIACHRSGHKREAAEQYEKVLMLNKRDLSSILNLASIYQSANQLEKAFQVVRRGRIEFRENILLKKKFAELMFLLKNYKMAEPLYARIMRLDSSFVVRKNYAICLYFNKGYEESLVHFDKLFFKNPNDPFVVFYYGLSLKKLERFEESEKYINMAIEIATPYYLTGFYHHLADNYRKAKKYKECIECYKKILELDSTKHEVYYDLATTYEEYNSNYTLALGYYREFLKNCSNCDEKSINYASERIKRIKEEIFMNE